MRTNFVVVPRKKTEDIDWIKPLKNYFVSIYGSSSDFSEDINILNETRSNTREVSADAVGLSIYYNYYSQLELLDLRVSFQQLNRSKKLCFSWYDAFETEISFKQYALAFEKASILFNLGALLSEVGKKIYLKSEENSFKESITCFQLAAGIYNFIGENFLHAPSGDLSQSSIRLLSKLMMAQAQECFLLKVIEGDTDQSKNSLIAKLSQGTANMFEDLANMSNNMKKAEFEVVDDLQDPESEINEEEIAKIDSNWSLIFEFKEKYYHALAWYFQALALEASKKHGDAIAYIQKSTEILNDISEDMLENMIHVKGSYEILDNFKMQKDVCSIKTAEMEKENDYIYHQIIPSKNSLTEIKAMNAVKEIPLTENTYFNEINERNYSNFLCNVIPVQIHELMSFYSEEKSQFLRNEIDQNDVSNQELQSALEYLGLPDKLKEFKELVSGATPQISLETKALANQIAESCTKDIANKRKIEELREKIYPYLQKQGEAYFKLKSSFLEASSRDKQLQELVSNDLYDKISQGPNSTAFKIALAPKTNMETSLLDIDDHANEKVSRRVDIISKLLYDINTVRADKSKTIESLKKAIHEEDNISDILILNSKVKSTNEIKNVIFPNELKKFEKYSKKLDTLIIQQKEFLEKLKEEWNKLQSDSTIKDLSNEKGNEWLQISSIENSVKELYKNWKKYSSGLASGVQFYKQLLNYAENINPNQEYLINGMENMNITGSSISSIQAPMSASSTGSGMQHQSAASPYQQYGSNTRPSEASGGVRGSQMSFNSSDTSGYSNYNRPGHPVPLPPQLPPKTPSFNSGTDANSTAQMSYRQPMSTSMDFNNHNHTVPNDHKQDHKGLIYDQPSTYQPNMYNFFSSK